MDLVSATLDVADLDSFLATVDDVATAHDVTIQAFDAALIAGPRHLERARELADRAIGRGENVARDRSVEILLYAAGRRQIDDALAMGVTEGEVRAVFLVDGGADRSESGTGEVEAGSDANVGEAGANAGEDDEAAALEDLTDRLDLRDVGDVGAGDPERIADYFEVTDAERAATDASLEDLVCERVALLEVEK